MALFKIEKTQTHKTIILLGIKIKLSVRKSAQEVFQHLLKYKNILEKEPINFEISNENQNYIWQYWHQGKNNTPKFVKFCMNSVENNSNVQEVKIIDKDNLFDYVQLPNYIIEKFKKGIIPYAHFSDIIRCALLVKHGGTWIDSTVMLSDKIPNEISNSKLFMFKTPSAHLSPKVPSLNFIDEYKQRFNFSNPYHCASSWFIHAKKDNILLKYVLTLLFEYWKNEDNLIDYFLLHYFIFFAVICNKKCAQEFEKMPSISNIAPHILQSHLHKPFNQKEFEKILEFYPIHKLTHKFDEKAIKDNSYLYHLLKNPPKRERERE